MLNYVSQKKPKYMVKCELYGIKCYLGLKEKPVINIEYACKYYNEEQALQKAKYLALEYPITNIEIIKLEV